MLFYYPGDDNWWLGSVAGGQLTWGHVGNTAGFGHAINDGRPFWTGDFTGNGSTDVLFYFPGDDNWWLGQMVNGQLSWSHAGNTAGFGHAINDGRSFWIGDFTGNGATDVLFHFRGDLQLVAWGPPRRVAVVDPRRDLVRASAAWCRPVRRQERQGPAWCGCSARCRSRPAPRSRTAPVTVHLEILDVSLADAPATAVARVDAVATGRRRAGGSLRDRRRPHPGSARTPCRPTWTARVTARSLRATCSRPPGSRSRSTASAALLDVPLTEIG